MASLQLQPQLESLHALLPERVAAACRRVPPEVQRRVEEIHLRQGRPLTLALGGRERFVDRQGRFVDAAPAAVHVSADDMRLLVDRLTQHSLYAWQEELRVGYLTVSGGHRVGLAGEVQIESGRILRLRQVAQVNIRRSRAAPGCALPLIRRLADGRGSLHSTLIISPPGCGKTTLLRDLCRLVSDGVRAAGLAPHTVGLVDERCEVAAAFDGEPQHDVGARTDVLSRATKPDGLRLLVRSMAPRVVATDEIGGEADAAGLFECSRAGVRVLATVHAASVSDVAARPSLRALVCEGAFTRAVVLSRRRGPGTIESVAVLSERFRPIR